MKTTGPFTQYNRAIVRRTNQPSVDVSGAPERLDKSLLGLFGAGEARFLTSFVEWSDADRTSY